MDGTTQTQEGAQALIEKNPPGGAVRLVRRIKHATRRKISVEDKVRIVLEGFRKELPVSDLCRRERISAAIYYNWSKNFIKRIWGQIQKNANHYSIRANR